MSASTEGLTKIANMIAGLQSPYIAVGGSGGEVFRKAVGAVIPSGSVIRFRTTLSLTEGNGDHTYLSLFSDATANPGSGVEIGDEGKLFTKHQTQVLNLECRITVQQGV